MDKTSIKIDSKYTRKIKEIYPNISLTKLFNSLAKELAEGNIKLFMNENGEIKISNSVIQMNDLGKIYEMIRELNEKYENDKIKIYEFLEEIRERLDRIDKFLIRK